MRHGPGPRRRHRGRGAFRGRLLRGRPREADQGRLPHHRPRLRPHQLQALRDLWRRHGLRRGGVLQQLDAQQRQRRKPRPHHEVRQGRRDGGLVGGQDQRPDHRRRDRPRVPARQRRAPQHPDRGGPLQVLLHHRTLRRHLRRAQRRRGRRGRQRGHPLPLRLRRRAARERRVRRRDRRHRPERGDRGVHPGQLQGSRPYMRYAPARGFVPGRPHAFQRCQSKAMRGVPSSQ